MFKKTPKNPQIDLLSSARQHLDTRRLTLLNDPTGWHNSFYHEIFIHIDEEIFRPIYHERMGAPNAPVNRLVAMMILKDAMGLSDQRLFEACRFHLLFRQALGLANLNDPIPTESTYYSFRSEIEAYEREYEVDLFGKVFAGITADQVIRFSISGKQVRMDSKLIGSNIAFYSRFELVHATMMRFCAELDKQARTRMSKAVAARMVELATEKASSVAYHANAEQIQDRLGELGKLTGQLLAWYSAKDTEQYELLERMFNEQFVVEKNANTKDDSHSGSPDDSNSPGGVTPRPSGEIRSDSLQSPHDADCTYRTKAGKKTKGYTVNVTETVGETNAVNLITDIQLAPAHHGDNDFVEPAISATQQLTEKQVETCYADGAYNQSLEHEQRENLEHVEMVLGGIQGAPSRYELAETETGVQVTDTQTGQVHQAKRTRPRISDTEPQWRIRLENGSYRTFGPVALRASLQRAKLRDDSYLERTRNRNNVEATIFHLSHRLRQAKTVYRGKIRTKLWAWGRALWVNMRRIQRYMESEVKFEVQMAS